MSVLADINRRQEASTQAVRAMLAEAGRLDELARFDAEIERIRSRA